MVNDFYIDKYNLKIDHRGFFTELYRKSERGDIAQINISYSKKHTLRGLHKTPYAKIVYCLSGSIYDVCLDFRPDSSTYLQHEKVILSDKNQNIAYIPPMCGHGFLALKNSLVLYCQTEEYSPNLDETYCYKQYNIDWPIDIKYISDKDSNICL